MYILLLAAASVRGQREAVVVPVGPKNRTEEEKQCVRQRLEAIVDSSGGGRLSGRPVYALSNESWVASDTQTYGVVRQQSFGYFGWEKSPWRSFAGHVDLHAIDTGRGQEALPPGKVRRRREARCSRPRHGPGAQLHGDDVHAAAGHARRGARGLLGGLTEQLVIYIGQ